jgi:beta-glucosidase
MHCCIALIFLVKLFLLLQLKQGGSIGIVGFTEYFEPLRDNELDRQAVSRALAFTNAW